MRTLFTVMKPRTAIEKEMTRISKKECEEGDYVWGEPDLIYMHDLLGPSCMEAMENISHGDTQFQGKVVLVNDHIFPPKDIQSANNTKNMVNSFISRGWTVMSPGSGIEHTLLIENGTIKPGMVVVGTDSHTVTAGAAGAFGIGLGSTDMGALLAMGKTWFKVPETMFFNVSGKRSSFITGKDIILEIIGRIGVDGANYRIMEILESADANLSADDDLSIANMTIEAGAKSCVIRNEKNPRFSALPFSDMEAMDHIEHVDISHMEPKISVPYSPGNVKNVRDVEGVEINQAYIGNCSNGTISDLRQAASILKGKKVHDNVNVIVVPATRNVYRQAISEGIVDIMLEAGATVGPSTCGACAGLHMGVLGKDDVCISNINRNFRGRMGDPSSKVYLANTYVVAMSAVMGKITVPE
jgi:homoaconitate hydratase family protein/3-isopropylmalate dehydratase, large subunit